MKVKANLYRGIEFVVEDDLPVNQQKLLAANYSIERIKIAIEGKIKSNCIQYSTYELWFNGVFKPEQEKQLSSVADKQTVFAARVLVPKT
jgi:hypothetical protein